MPVDDLAATGATAAYPTFIGGNERPLFCWHHAPSANRRRGAGVLICPPLGYEYMSSYRTLRVLAEQLAELGFDALRLDYDGTGNSYGGGEDADRLEAWVRSIQSGIAETRRLAGSNAVAVVGLRAGALLALQASADPRIERLVLWNPFASGRAYVRELKALARLSHRDDDGESDGEPATEREEDGRDVINAEGHVFTRHTLETFSAWGVHDLAAAPAAEVLIIDRDDRPVDAALQAHLTLLGCQITRQRAAGTAEMLAPPHLAKVPTQTVEDIASWLAAWQLPGNFSGAPSIRSDTARTTNGSGALRHPDFIDEAVHFGPGGCLFGMLASPVRPRKALPTVILFNTGAGHHVGPHRLYAPLARDLASRGHVVLRFDLGGIGDSAPLEPANTGNRAYPPGMLEDARTAVAFLRGRVPGVHVMAAGLCSGGWLAFDAARTGIDVDAIVAVNPPLYLRDGAAGVAWLDRVRELERYQRSMREPAKWMKGLRGRASVSTFMRVAAGAVARKISVRASGLLGAPLPEGLGKDLCDIADRGVRAVFVFSRGDNGLAYFNLHAPPALRRRRVRALIEQVIVEGAGHAFRPCSAQHTLRRLLTDLVGVRQ